MARAGNLTYGAAYAGQNGFATMGRIGIAAKGVVYVLVGVLALMAAFGQGGDTTGSKGALTSLVDEPFGEVALVLIGVGLLAYSLWRMVGAFRDTENEGSHAKGFAKRAAAFVIGLIYGSLGLYALGLAFGNGGGQGGGGGAEQTQTWTARLLEAPFGMLLVVLIGLGVIVAGIAQMVKGWKEKFREDLDRMPGRHEWVIGLGKAGYIARGIVLGIIGLFVVQAALRHDPSNVRGMEGALDTLAAQPFGQLLLGVVAAGLACYGAYSIVEARFRAF